MSELRHATVHLNPKWARLLRFSFITRVFRALWARILTCSARSIKYRRVSSFRLPSPTHTQQDCVVRTKASGVDSDVADADVAIKISLLGDCHTGKTCFMNKYVGNMEEEEEERGLHMTGLNLMDKILLVKGAKIAFNIWDVKGDNEFLGHVPMACKDSVAILIMFDLTSRSTLFNAICWYQRARKWNKTAIPILIGTKFDDFAQLPLDMQLAIVNEARAYARAMNATLFFSSSTHNINVNKIFKFIFAKIFDLPWTVKRNLTVGEPIIDF